MKDVSALVTKIENAFDAERASLDKKIGEINQRNGEIVRAAEALEKREKELLVKEQSLSQREEFISVAENKAREDKLVQEDKIEAAAKKGQAEKLNKEAQAALDEAKQIRDNVYQREIALSEREKKYKDEIKLEILNNLTGLK